MKYLHLDALVQEIRNSIANAPELRLSCTILSIHQRISLYSRKSCDRPVQVH